MHVTVLRNRHYITPQRNRAFAAISSQISIYLVTRDLPRIRTTQYVQAIRRRKAVEFHLAQ